MNDVVLSNSAQPAALSLATEEVSRAALAPGTLSLYRAHVEKLDLWLQARGWEASDISIAEYLTDCFQRGWAPGTVSIVPAAAKYAAKMSGQPNPCGAACARALAGIRRLGRGRGNGQARGIGWAEAEAVAAVALAEPTPAAYRDAALVLLMSDCLLRVGETVAVQVDDIEEQPDGSGRLLVRRSKTDQEGRGAVMYLGPPTMAAVREWQCVSGVDSGPLFRRVRRGGRVEAGAITDHGARKVLKARAAAAGVKGRVSGHSLRVGSAQSLASAGAGLVELQQAGRWSSPSMPAHYARGQLAGRGAVARLRHGA